jgi:RNA polymerase subunit RPABC4/transcription elongation factor Spt4
MANSSMTLCKACGTEIPKAAKFCPTCGAKNKSNKPILGILIIAVCVVVIIAAFSGGDDGPKKVVNDITDKTGTEQAVQTKFGVGDRVELKNIVVTLKSVTESKGSKYIKPNDGNVFVLCEFDIENNSSEDIYVSSMLSFQTYYDGYTTPISFTALLEKGGKNQLDGAVAAGKKFNGVIGYEIPKDWKELEINFKPDFWTVKDITFIANH